MKFGDAVERLEPARVINDRSWWIFRDPEFELLCGKRCSSDGKALCW